MARKGVPVEPADKDEAQQREAVRLIAEARVKTGDFIARLMIAYVGFAAFCVFTLLSPDRLMIEAKPSLNMPFAGNVSFLAFMLVAPLILIGMRVYLEVYVLRWRDLDAELGSDSRPKTISPLKHPLLRVFSWFALYPLLPAVLAVFTWKAAAKDVWGEAFLVLSLLCAMAPVYRLIRWPWLARVALIVTGAGLLSVPWLRADGLPHRGLNLAREDFEEAFLFGENLKNADLTKADLTGADLRLAKLLGASLDFADLTGAGLTRANLAGANLRGANLERAFLQAANLTGANLESANLRGAVLEGADLTQANLGNADLTHANLRRTNLKGAELVEANLTDADLWEANLTDAYLYGANLEDANFWDANITGADFEDAQNIPDLSESRADSANPPRGLPRGAR